MLYDKFIVTSFDPETGYGYLRQTASANRFPLRQEPIGFSTGIGKGICEFHVSDHGYGIRIPSDEIAQRTPEIGTSIMGVIALELSDCVTALDEHGHPFLRNWFYTDQHDAVISRENTTDDDDAETDEDNYPEDGSGDGELDEEDVPSTTTVYARALAAFHGDHDRAREATEMYPGDFV